MPAPIRDPHLNQALYGDAVLLGTIVATTTKDNGDTSVPFNNTGEQLKGKLLLIQSDVAVYIKQNSTASAGVTAANGVKVLADEKFFVNMRSNKGYLSVLPVSGTANVKVFEQNG